MMTRLNTSRKSMARISEVSSHFLSFVVWPSVLCGLFISMCGCFGHAVWAQESIAQEPDAPMEEANQVSGLQIGSPLSPQALQLPLLDMSQQSVSLEDLRQANGLMLIFSANTCPYVLDWLERLPRLAAISTQNEVALVVINSNERKRKSTDSALEMAALWQDRGFQMPYLVDRDATLADALGAQRTPEVFLFDAQWGLVYRGAIDDLSGPFEQVTTHYATDALQQMLSGGELLQESTPALGCAIQRPRRRRAKTP